MSSAMIRKRLMIGGLCIVSIILLSSHCENTIPPIDVYKTKSDYSEYVPVELSGDRTQITSAPGFMDERPAKLIYGYYLGGTMGLYTGYLSMTIEEYNNNEYPPSLDTISKLIMEKDPFIEYYESKKSSALIDENTGIDTFFINQLIMEDRLEEYFVRLK